jgi:NTE family protein
MRAIVTWGCGIQDNRNEGFRLVRLSLLIAVVLSLAAGCAHYPVNKPITQVDREGGYRGKFMGTPGNSDELLLYLTFSGGGTRASALSYGVLETLRDTEVTIGGSKRRLLDEVDAISAVSGGSFTAGYYGLFGERIFQDFEGKFLKENVQGTLLKRTLLNPYNWMRLYSPYFDRSDLAAEYYDDHIFDHGTFGDIAARKGPMVLINATDMVEGTRVAFTQDGFDVICSDLSSFPVARAAAASSAVPGVLSPIVIRNYAGTCGFTMPKAAEAVLRRHDTRTRQFHLLTDLSLYLDRDKKKYIHLVDGGVADNLGIRAALDRVLVTGNVWTTLKAARQENVHKVAFIVVNAETAADDKWYVTASLPGFGALISSYSTIAITRYNFETIMLLQESFEGWKRDVQQGRCGDTPISTEPGACGDITFYLIEVQFSNLEDMAEQDYFKRLPTSFALTPEQVDKLREVARRLLNDSGEFQRFLKDLR